MKRNQKDISSPISNELSTDKRIKKPQTNKIGNTPKPPAILAIEILDPNENSTSKYKNHKRTVNSEVGYGYQPSNHFGVSDKPKLVYYKYSQHDIPAYKGNEYHSIANSQDVNAQRSIEYNSEKNVQYSSNGEQQHQNFAQYYQPGTMLFTTLDQNGHVNQLTSQEPKQHANQNIPVIYLKIYSNQLSNGALYPNLPDNHPYSNLNGVNLQSLLNNYLQNAYVTNDQNNQDVYAGHPQQNQQLYQAVGQNYQQDQNQDYYLTQPVEYHQGYQDQSHQYQYQEYQQPQQVAQVYQEVNSADNLPTQENYPDDAHTRVIFHSDNGGHFPEKPQYLKPNSVSSITGYKTQTGHIPHAQSYSSINFKPSQPDFTLNQQPQHEEQGYYYPNPSTGNYYSQNVIQGYQPQYTEQINHKSTDHETPYNYHAHPINSRKRNVRRPSLATTKIAKIKQEH